MKSKIKNLVHKKINRIFNTTNVKTFCTFKNTIPITLNNLNIENKITYLEVTTKNLESYELPIRKFLFDKEEITPKLLIENLQKEYNILFKFSQENEKKLNEIFKSQKYEKEKKNFLQQIEEIKKCLNITNNEENELFAKLFNDAEKLDLNELKKKYFLITQEIERLNKIKDLIDSKVNFRINLIFLILISFLSAITGFFYHCIYNVEELGWDLVEPTTFLFSSIVYLLCLFWYVKLQKRGFYSTNHLYSELKNRLRLRRYVIYNFNFERYNILTQNQKLIWKTIERKQRI